MPNQQLFLSRSIKKEKAVTSLLDDDELIESRVDDSRATKTPASTKMAGGVGMTTAILEQGAKLEKPKREHPKVQR